MSLQVKTDQNMNIKIIGAKGNINHVNNLIDEIRNFSKRNECIVQILNADLVFGKNHLISAVNHASRAFNTNTNSTNSLEMEILLYASCERQIKIAIQRIGITKGKSNIAFVIINDTKEMQSTTLDSFLKKMRLTRDDKVLDGNRNTLVNFGLTEKEISTVSKKNYEDLILEKVAKVDIIK